MSLRCFGSLDSRQSMQAALRPAVGKAEARVEVRVVGWEADLEVEGDWAAAD